MVELETQEGSGGKGELAVSVTGLRAGVFQQRVLTGAGRVTHSICFKVILKFPWMQLLFTFRQGALLLGGLAVGPVGPSLWIRRVLILFSAISPRTWILGFQEV